MTQPPPQNASGFRGFRRARFDHIALTTEGGRLYLVAPFSAVANERYRAAGGSFDRGAKCWMFPALAEQQVRQALLDTFGTTGGSCDVVDVVVCADDDSVLHDNGSLTFAGRELARRKSPTEYPRLGPGISLAPGSAQLLNRMGSPPIGQNLTFLGRDQKWSDFRFVVPSVPVAWFQGTPWASWFDAPPEVEPVDLHGPPPAKVAPAGGPKRISWGRVIAWWVLVVGGDVVPAHGKLAFTHNRRTLYTVPLTDDPNNLRLLLGAHAERGDDFNVEADEP